MTRPVLAMGRRAEYASRVGLVESFVGGWAIAYQIDETADWRRLTLANAVEGR